MASTFTVTAAAQPTATPPRVKLSITQTGTPALSSVTVNRTDAAGNVFPVRTSDGDVVTISGGSAVAYDQEAPFGQSLTYTVAANNQPTATATLTVTRPWLQHLGKPRLSVSFTMGRGGIPAEDWDVPQGVFQVLGSAYPIVITAGARIAPSMTLPVLVRQASELAGLRTLLAGAAPLLLNVPPGYGLDSNYVAVGKVNNAWLSPLVADANRLVSLPYQVIGRPGGSAQPVVMFSDLTYSSYSAIPSGTTWAQLAG